MFVETGLTNFTIILGKVFHTELDFLFRVLLAALLRGQEEVSVADFALVERLVLFAVGHLTVTCGSMKTYFDFDALLNCVVHEEAVTGVGIIGQVVRVDLVLIDSDRVHELLIIVKDLEEKCVVVEEVPRLTRLAVDQGIAVN